MLFENILQNQECILKSKVFKTNFMVKKNMLPHPLARGTMKMENPTISPDWYTCRLRLFIMGETHNAPQVEQISVFNKGFFSL